MTDRDPSCTSTTPPGAGARASRSCCTAAASTSRTPVRASQLAVLRMLPFVAVAAPRRRARTGWPSPACVTACAAGTAPSRRRSPTSRWALDRLAERFPDVPGRPGRALDGRPGRDVRRRARRACGTVVGLAPWIEPGDPVEPLAGRRLLIVHGDRDRMTSPRASAAFARAGRARSPSRSAYVRVAGERHAMLRRARLWHELATGFVAGDVCWAARPREPSAGGTAKVLTGHLPGAPSLVV